MIQIQGLKSNRIELRKDENGKFKLTGQYSIMTQNGVVLATQSYNEYSDVKFNPSADLNSKLIDVQNQIEKELNTQFLGV